MDSFVINPPRGYSLLPTTHNGVLNEERMDLSPRPRALGANYSAPAVVPGPTSSAVASCSGADSSGPKCSQGNGNTAVSGAPGTTDYFADLLKAAAFLGTTPFSDEATDAPTARAGTASSDTASDPNSSVERIRPTGPTDDSGTSSRAGSSGACPAVG